MKTLESSIADRLSELTSSRPCNRDAFVNHLTILERARISYNHRELRDVVKKAAVEFSMAEDPQVLRVCDHIMNESRKTVDAKAA